jgi:DNA mismatch repair protein MutS2
LETKLASLLKDFEFQMRETVRAIEDRAAQQKLSKEAERRILRLRREFQESFNQTVVAHRTGADQGDANAQPHILKHVAAGDQVRLKSMNKIAVVQRESRKTSLKSLSAPSRCASSATTSPSLRLLGRVCAGEAPRSARRRPQQKNVHVTVTSANTDDMRMEINLIGRTVDEATGSWKSIWTAPSSPACPASASSTATAPASSAAASANS